MTLRVLGAGGAFSRNYGTTCSLLTRPCGQRWLIDCGRQAPEQLDRAEITWHSIDGQFVTHVHGDHVFGLEEMALVRYYSPGSQRAAIASGGPRPRLLAHSAVLRELWEALGPSLRYLTDTEGNPVGGGLADYFDVVPSGGSVPPALNRWHASEQFTVDGLGVKTRETRHIPGKPSTSLEFELPEQNGRVAWWSGDALVDAPALEQLGARASILFHDCTFSSALKSVHAGFEQLAQLPESLRRRMVLMHHDDDVGQFVDTAQAKGFRVLMPGDVYDLVSGCRLTAGS